MPDAGLALDRSLIACAGVAHIADHHLARDGRIGARDGGRAEHGGSGNEQDGEETERRDHVVATGSALSGAPP